MPEEILGLHHSERLTSQARLPTLVKKWRLMMFRQTFLAMMIAFGPLAVAAQDATSPPAGEYQLDLGHARVLFQVNHLGASNYTALFTDFEATLAFDPADPAAMRLRATIQAASVETHYPDPAVDFNAVIAGPEFLDAAQFPTITFTSTAIVLTGNQTAEVTGDLTLHGVTKPVTLTVTYNGGYGANDFDPAGARIGFSATGSLRRTDFGIGFGVPAPGTTFGVGDAVTIIIEAEFSAKLPAP
jgi:polyisoprenoid-binding protein YceI